MKLGIVAIMLWGLVGLTACSKDDDRGKNQSSASKTDEVISNISALQVAESGTNVVSSAENVAFVAAARANSDPVTKEPCTKHNVSVATNM